MNRRVAARITLAGLGMASVGSLPAVLAQGALPSPAPEADARGVDLTIQDVMILPVKVPFRPVPERNMARELPHWQYFEVLRVKLASGHVGYGESMAFYTWGRTMPDDIARARGQNAARLLWDDSLGSGLQTALLDAVGRALGVPAHALLGKQVRDRAALSWWAIDMPPEDWAAECQEARKLGYQAFKTKGRPWFDIFDQLKAVAAVVPTDFKVDMDFNDTLLDASRAIPLLKRLESFAQVGIYETPIPQKDVPGNQAIRKEVATPIAMHYDTPPAIVAIREGVCDGFVIGGGAKTVVQQGTVADMAGMPFWLQLVGTGITATFGLHLAAVLRAATWPAVNCHQLYVHPLLKSPIVVRDGKADVPTGPGLGVEVDEAALERFQVDFPKQRPEPDRLLEIQYGDGKTQLIASDGQVNWVLRRGNDGTIRYWVPHTRARLVPDDGSATHRENLARAKQGAFYRN
ncbi:MAG: mandelate racemase/muconate lactonizing enzyme family protein [Isosphaeraceae bacterium]